MRIKSEHIIIVCTLLTIMQSCTVIKPYRIADQPAGRVTLTFDDGPNVHGQVTEKVLAVLSKHRVTGYFCVTGMNVRKYPVIVKQIYEQGHILVNHGYTDGYVFNKGKKRMESDLVACNDAIRTAIGDTLFTPRYYRPPNGMYLKSMKKIWQKYGMELLPLSFYALDAQRTARQADRVLQSTLRKIRRHNGGIIVLHDGRDGWEKLGRKLAQDSTGTYNRAWIPECLDTLITVLQREGIGFN